jgi:hypothetical protein
MIDYFVHGIELGLMIWGFVLTVLFPALIILSLKASYLLGKLTKDKKKKGE